MAQHAGQIHGPEQAHKAQSPAHWAQSAVAFGTANGTFTSLTDRRAERIDAQINGGRWVVRCEHCENAPSAEPEWDLAICYECGWTYAPRFPSAPQRHRIEWLLMERPLRHRNWLPDQSVKDLQDENEAAGLESDPPPYKPPLPVPPVEIPAPTPVPPRPPITEPWPPPEVEHHAEEEETP